MPRTNQTNSGIEVARKRFLQMADLAAMEIDEPDALNSVSVGLICRLIDKRGIGGAGLLVEMQRELLGEFAKTPTRAI